MFIYALRCPETEEIRYIGKAEDPKRRLMAHIACARHGYSDCYSTRWIKRLLERSLEPKLVILCRLPNEANWQAVERLLIAAGKIFGLKLTNIALGGDGVSYIDEAACKTARAATIAGVKAAWADPIQKTKRIAAIKATHAMPETKARLAAEMVEVNARPEVKAKRSAALKARWDDPQKRTEFEASRVQGKEAMSSARKAYWADPEKAKALKAAQKAAWADPDKKAERLAKRNAMWADPERRAELIEAQKAAWAKRKAA